MSTSAVNLKLGIRSLRRSPAFTAAAIITLALGVGLSSAVVTVASTLLVKPLPMMDQESLVVLWGRQPGGGFENYPVGLEGARAFRADNRMLESVAFFGYEGASPAPIREGDQISRMNRSMVSGDFFDVLGAAPELGRAFNASDDLAGAAPVVVLSHKAFRQRYAADSSVVGRQIIMHDLGRTFTIIGVMPQGLDFPRGTDIWAPVIATTPEAGLRYAAFNLVGRLRPGATAGDAREELSGFFGRTESGVWQRGLEGVAHKLPRLLLGDTRPALLVFAAASALLLIIASINVANLLLVRGLARLREFATRSALGAGRREIVLQLLAENAILAVGGCVSGIAVAWAAVRMFKVLAPVSVPRLDEIVIDPAALGGALVLSLVALLVFGLAPALYASRIDIQQVLRSGATHSGGRRSRIIAEAIVGAQVALAVVVMSAAALLTNSLVRLENADLRFDSRSLFISELALEPGRFNNVESQRALLDALIPRIRELPNVVGVTPMVAVPFAGSRGWDGRLALESQSPEEAASNPMLNMEVVTPDYFATFGVPVVRGRAFNEGDRDASPGVVMLSEGAARYYWGDGDPIGRRLGFGGQLEHKLTVVGVVPDTRYRDLRNARPSVYFPLRQSVFPFVPLTLAVRLAANSESDAALKSVDLLLRRTVDETALGAQVISTRPFGQFMDEPLAQPRLSAVLLVIFASASLLLAAVGLYGVIATDIRQRTRELGVRMALGATAGVMLRLLLVRGLAVAGVGALAGLIVALVGNRALSGLLYDLSPSDPATLSLTMGLMLAVAALATLVPARMVMRVDPTISLKSD